MDEFSSNKKRSMTEICSDIAETLMVVDEFKTVAGKKEDEIWIYDEGIYKPIGKTHIKVKAEQQLGQCSKTTYVNEIINKIARNTYIDRDSFVCKDLNLVCVNNGVLNLKTKKLMDHNPKYYFLNKLPINYIPNAHCDMIFKFLSEVFHEDDLDCIQEWFGYQLYREYFIKKACIFRGIPDTGKTTFMNLLCAFVGEKNYSSISLQLLSQGKWHVAELYNKTSNICDDLSERDVTDGETFKQLTGRSQIQGEYKFGDQFRFKNYAKLCFACNKIPIISGDADDQAYWNRWMIFDFDNVFNRENKNTDNHIIDKITSEGQLSGLLNWALEGLERLQENGSFSYNRSWEDNRRIMQGEASSIARYCHECLINETGAWVSNSDLFEQYEKFCRINDISNVEQQRKFGIDMRKYCNYGNFNSNKNNIFGVRNIKIRSPLPIMGT